MTASAHDQASDATLRRIQKLLAIAADSRGDPAETAAAAAMAEKMMRKFNLDSAELQRAALKRDPGAEMVTMRVRANMKRDDANRTPLKRAPKWAGYIGFEVAQLHDVHVRYAIDHALGGAVVEFCGVKADVQVAAWMFDYLIGQMILSVRDFGVRFRRAHGGAAPLKTDSDAYRTGFIAALCAALQRLRAEKAAEVSRHAAGTALVVCKQQAIAAHFGDFEYRNSGAARPVRNADAFHAGLDAGRKVDVGRKAVGSAEQAQLRLQR